MRAPREHVLHGTPHEPYDTKLSDDATPGHYGSDGRPRGDDGIYYGRDHGDSFDAHARTCLLTAPPAPYATLLIAPPTPCATLLIALPTPRANSLIAPPAPSANLHGAPLAPDSRDGCGDTTRSKPSGDGPADRYGGLTLHRERANSGADVDANRFDELAPHYGHNDANGETLRHERNDDANDDDAGAGARDTTPGAGELYVDGNIARFDGPGIYYVDPTNFGGTEGETVRSGGIFPQRDTFHGDSDDSDNVMIAPDTRFFYDRTDSDTDGSMPELVSASESDDSTSDNQDHADDENDMANSEI
jgi:hypothetical protein